MGWGALSWGQLAGRQQQSEIARKQAQQLAQQQDVAVQQRHYANERLYNIEKMLERLVEIAETGE